MSKPLSIYARVEHTDVLTGQVHRMTRIHASNLNKAQPGRWVEGRHDRIWNLNPAKDRPVVQVIIWRK